MQTFDFVGTLTKIGDVVSFPSKTGSDFTKREILVNDEDPRYPQDVVFSLVRDRTHLVDNITVGSRIKVSFDVRCRAWNDRHFVELNCWKIQPADAAASATTAATSATTPTSAAPAAPIAPAPASSDPIDNGDVDALPF